MNPVSIVSQTAQIVNIMDNLDRTYAGCMDIIENYRLLRTKAERLENQLFSLFRMMAQLHDELKNRDRTELQKATLMINFFQRMTICIGEFQQQNNRS